MLYIAVIVGIVCLAYLVRKLLAGPLFTPAPAWIAGILDSPIRYALQSPDRAVSRSKIGRGMRVLEVGCGNGAVAAVAARAVGPAGAVYGLDIQPAMLDLFQRKLEGPGHGDIRNVQLVVGDALALPFPAESFDVVYLVEALGEIPDQPRALAEMRRVLKPDGALAVTEFFIDPHYARKGVITRRCAAAGLAPDAGAGTFWHFTATFRKA